MNTLKLLFAGTALLLLGSCAAPQVEVGGIFYDALTEKEERQLVSQARFSMHSIRKKLTPWEREQIASREPALNIRYSGHRFGRATVVWRLPEREAGVVFEGQFLTRHMSASIYTRPIQPELLDYSRRNGSAPPPQKRPPSRRTRNK